MAFSSSQFVVNVNFELTSWLSGIMQFPVATCFILFDSVRMNWSQFEVTVIFSVDASNPMHLFHWFNIVDFVAIIQGQSQYI